ncbi:MAG TPA: GNAT family N-acetyltransferase [Amycolatopsis sp.]|nr:GNAT family N-acetyltransferase [Amycolatopsis sp.]
MDHESPSPGTVRPATVSDATAIGEINVLSWQAAYSGLLPDDFLRRLSAEARSRMWADVLGGPDRSGTVLVVETAGAERHLAGFVAFGPPRGHAGTELGQLYALYLHPRHWDRGLGRLLHERAVQALADDGYRTAILWVLATNERAKNFYARHGWRPDGGKQAERMEGVTLDEIRYRRSLP